MQKTIHTERFLWICCLLAGVGFAARVWADYYKLQAGVSAAPFSHLLLERSLEFLLPGVCCLAAALWLRVRGKSSASIKPKE